MTSENSKRARGRESATTTVAAVRARAAPKKIQPSGGMAAASAPTGPSSVATAPTKSPPMASRVETRAPRMCGRPRTPVRASSSRSGSTFTRWMAAPSAAPAIHAHGAAGAGGWADSGAREGKAPKPTRNGKIETGVALSPALYAQAAARKRAWAASIPNPIARDSPTARARHA